MRVNFVTNAGKSQFKKKTDDIWVVQGIPMTVDNAVMNSIYYPAEDNAKGLNSYLNKPVTLRHPLDKNGNPTSALSGDGLFNHYSGGVITNTYNHNGVNYFDAEFNVNMMRAQNGGDMYADKIEKGEPIGISTGLYFDGNNEEGVTANGERYIAVARNQKGDHVAMLPDSEPPAGGQSTFMRFNGENNDQEITVNIDEFIANAEVSEPTRSLIESVKEWCKSTFALRNATTDNGKEFNKNSQEVDAMRETMIAALAAKGITVNAEITDAELLAKYTEANTPDVAAAVNAAIKPVQEELAKVQAAITANADKELDELAVKAAEVLGVEKDEAKAMGVNALHKVLAKNGVVVGAPNAVNHESPKGEIEKPLIDMAPWEAK